jgi:serine/threonine protein kinase
MNSGPLTIQKLSNYAIQLAHGLAAAHEKGITHRDLKPENIFITRDDRIKILDFGLARQAVTMAPHDDETVTAPNPTSAGVVLGTAGYMSPEQVRGLAVDPRSDIFSFGTILYEMSSGQRAFESDSTVETMSAILQQDPPRLSDDSLPVSPALQRIMRRCLEKDRVHRFQSAKDLGYALEAVSGLSPNLPQAVTPAHSHRLSVLIGSAALVFWTNEHTAVGGKSGRYSECVPFVDGRIAPTSASRRRRYSEGAPALHLPRSGRCATPHGYRFLLYDGHTQAAPDADVHSALESSFFFFSPS